MRIQTFLAGAAAIALLTACGTEPKSADTSTLEEASQSPVNTIQPPVAKREAKTIDQVGRTRTDHYFWMKDDNWQDVMKGPNGPARRYSRIPGS